jgi:CBS domain containing-hemolysin-like protein
MRVEQAAQVLGANWHSPGDTLATFFIRQIGTVPATGEQITIEGIDLIIEAVEGDTVSSVLVLPPSPQHKS